MTLLSVPVIDVSGFRSKDAAARRRVADEVGQACRDIGFLIISGHGVPDAVIDDSYRSARAFFALPVAEKMLVKQPSPDQVRGYSAVGAEGLSYSLDQPTPPDLKESYSIGPITVDRDDPYYTCAEAGPHFAPNIWPSKPPELQYTWTTYFNALASLAADLMRMFALARDLPETFFDSTIDRHISMFRALQYPDQPTPPEPGQMRAGVHSRLRQPHDPAPGAKARRPAGVEQEQ